MRRPEATEFLEPSETIDKQRESLNINKDLNKLKDFKIDLVTIES